MTDEQINTVEQDELLLAAKEVLANGHQHDVGGGDVFVGTCEAAERLQRAVDARAASTSANVAQGAEAVGQFQCTHYAAFAEAHKQVAVEVDALRETLGRKTAAPPAQTALTDDARDAALWRYLAQHAVIVDASVEGMVSFTVAKDADTGAAQDTAARAIDMLAAQSASGDTK